MSLESALAPFADRLKGYLSAGMGPLLVSTAPGFPLGTLAALTLPKARRLAGPSVQEVRAFTARAAVDATVQAVTVTVNGCSPAAQSALLKFVEEPPPGVTLLLLYSRPYTVLPTIVSRCANVEGPTGDALADVRVWCLALAGVEIPIARRHYGQGYPGSIPEALLEARTDPGPVAELLSAVGKRDPVRALAATRGLVPDQVKLLRVKLSRHIAGVVTLPELRRVPVSVLYQWVEALSDRAVPRSVAVRAGLMVALGA